MTDETQDVPPVVGVATPAGGSARWATSLVTGVLYVSSSFGLFLPAGTVFENRVATARFANDALSNSRLSTTSFGLTSLKELRKDQGIKRLVLTGLWSQANDFLRGFAREFTKNISAEFYKGYHMGRYQTQPILTPLGLNRLHVACNAFAAFIVYPLEVMCFRYRHKLPYEGFKSAYYRSDSITPYLTIQFLVSILHGPIAIGIHALTFPFAARLLTDPTGMSPAITKKDKLIVECYRVGVAVTELLILSAITAPLFVVWVRALAAESDGGVGGGGARVGNLVPIVKEIFNSEGIRGFYKGWLWFLLSSLDNIVVAPIVTPYMLQGFAK